MDRLGSVDQGYDSHGRIQMVLPKNLHNRPAGVSFRRFVRNRWWLLPRRGKFAWRDCPDAYAALADRRIDRWTGFALANSSCFSQSSCALNAIGGFRLHTSPRVRQASASALFILGGNLAKCFSYSGRLERNEKNSRSSGDRACPHATSPSPRRFPATQPARHYVSLHSASSD